LPLLQQILAHPVCFWLFREFVAKSLSVEMLHFYAWSQAYSLLPTGAMRATVAPQLLELFIESTGAFQVNLSSSLVTSLRNHCSRTRIFPATLFQEAQAEVFTLLNQNYYKCVTPHAAQTPLHRAGVRLSHCRHRTAHPPTACCCTKSHMRALPLLVV
jgi:hypothetical protein